VNSIGVVVADSGAAIITVKREPLDDPIPGENFLVTAIERLPFDLARVTQRLKELDDPDIAFTIDADGLGSALWTVVGGPDNRQHFQLYSGRGLERQALVDELLVAIEEGRFHFAPDLPEQPSMSKAMVSYRRQVKEDGLIGSELVVALLLAIRPLPVKAWFAYA
jgi:hypothetical protein